MDTEKDSYLTVEGEAEAVYRQLSSKFFAYAYHVESEQQIKEHLDALRKRYYDATHHCYAYRLGHDGGWDRGANATGPTMTANPRRQPASRSSDSCSRPM